MTDAALVRMGPQGRIVVPAELRKRLALTEGTTLAASAKDGRLILEPRSETLRRMRERYSRVPRDVKLVAELEADRKAEVRRDQTR